MFDNWFDPSCGTSAYNIDRDDNVALYIVGPSLFFVYFHYMCSCQLFLA